MSKEDPIKVSRIINGTVIDHLQPGLSDVLKKLWKMDWKYLAENQTLFLTNVPSTTYGRKDIIKLPDVFLSKEQMSLVKLVSPKATINLIENGQVRKKVKIKLTGIRGILYCLNSSCVAYKEASEKNIEGVEPRFMTLDAAKTNCYCFYCGEEYLAEDLVKEQVM